MNGLKYWKKVLGEASKNHRVDSEDLRKGGLILHEKNEFGINPGDYFELFLTKLEPSAKFLFSIPIQSNAKNFKIHKNPKVWYTKNKCGKHSVAKAMPVLSEIVGLRHITNHQLRSTAINAMLDAEISTRELMSFSGHSAETTVTHYAKVPSLKRQIEMSRAIANNGKKAKLDSQEPSTSKMAVDTRKDKKEQTFDDDFDHLVEENDSIFTQVEESYYGEGPSKMVDTRKIKEKMVDTSKNGGKGKKNSSALTTSKNNESGFDDAFDPEFMQENETVISQVEESFNADEFLKKEQELATLRMKFAEKYLKK